VNKKRSRLRKILIGIGITLGIIGAGIVYIFSGAIIPIPKPSGPNLIGYTTTTITDSSRTMNTQKTPRVITLDLWYPASSTDGLKAAPYTENTLNKMLEKYQGIPASVNGETPSFAFQNAPVIPGSHPTVIFNHGYSSFSKQNASNFQELASHGYFVISIAHPGDSLIARDGQNNLLEFDATDSVYQKLSVAQKETGYAQALATKLQAQRNAKTPLEYATASHELAQTLPYSELEPIKQRWLEDTLFVIHTLSQADSQVGKPKILEATNANEITVMGHSLGGIVALEVAKNPPVGVQRVIDLDGSWLETELTQNGSGENTQIRVPLLAMLSTQNMIQNQDLGLHGSFDQLLRRTSGNAHVIEIAGTAHFNFTDLNFIPILKRFAPVLGDVDNKRMASLQNQAILEFLKRDPSSPKTLLPDSSEIKQTFFPAR
jgi:Platelet-activating factor acetylhydrolase, isoform II